MVLGFRSKHRRGASVSVNYIVHVQEIRPWPPSESLRSIQTLLLQWENGNQYSGSFFSAALESKLVINESFKLPLTLSQDKKAHDKFQKNCLEFSLYAPRKNKAKGQLLGTAILNLADYGVIENILSINVSVNLKKSSNTSVQPALVISLEPVGKGSSNSSPNVGLSKEPSLDNDVDDSEIASFTDDDVSFHSSRTEGSSTFEAATSSLSQNDKNGYGNAGFDPEQNWNQWSLYTDAPSDTGNDISDKVSSSKFYEQSMISVEKKCDTPFIGSSPSSISVQDINGKPNTIVASFMQGSVSHNSDEVIANSKHKTTEKIHQSVEEKTYEGFAPEVISADNYRKNADNSESGISLYSHASQEKELQPEVENTEQSAEEKSFEGLAPEAMSADNCRKSRDNSNSAISLYSHASEEKELQPEVDNTQQSLEEKAYEGFSPEAMSANHYRKSVDNSESAIYLYSLAPQEKELQSEIENTQQSANGKSFEIFAPEAMPAAHYRKDADDSESVIFLYSHTSQEKELPPEIESTQQSVEEKSYEGFAPKAMAADNSRKVSDSSDSAIAPHSHVSQEKEVQPEDVQTNDAHVSLVNVEGMKELKHSGSDDQIMEDIRHFPENQLFRKLSEDASREPESMLSKEAPAAPLPSNIKAQLDIPDDYQKKGEHWTVIERKEPDAEVSGCKDEWKTRVEMLEEELREAAAVEIGLYSIVAEHASSGNKVHAPARRLSRFYSNACKGGSQAKRASAARAAVSGLVLVCKSCGNDVPRLTFWLSNAIMLRAIVSQIAAEFPYSNGPEQKTNGTGSELTERLPHKWLESSHVEREQSKTIDESDDGSDVLTFIIALEKIESWLFSRIVESVWWQSFTPHMQPTVAKGSSATSGSGTKKTCGRRNSLSNHDQGNFSIELWKKAFQDACEKLCPIRAGGHECGCLSVLVRLVMEQLVNRLDVAMFNAILRESSEEMPTDPLSDPITDSKVLPIPPGKSSFGAGVELKNSIGNWSRWLTDLFGLEDNSSEHSDISGECKRPKSFKSFHLLHALSDLMMLPFGMLADASTRKEVCPMFGPTIIKRVLNSFIPDEFCPDPVPKYIIDALDKEEASDFSGDLLTSITCTASPTKYSPPPAALLTCVGEDGNQVLHSSGLSTLKKSYNSDDELDELNSPLTSVIPDSFQGSALAKLSFLPKEKGGRNVVRYKLLREIWKDNE